MSEKTVRVGIMPGRIVEYVVATGTPIGDVLAMAELNAAGYDVKVDGNTVTNLGTPVTETTNLILLVKQVKGNIEKTVRVGVMPGRIVEYVVEVGTSVRDVLGMANLNPAGYDVKIDGSTVDYTSAVVSDNTNLILLVKQVKGNK